MKRPSKSYEIALSAIACAFAAMALTLGSYVGVLLPSGYILAVFALMLPLAKGFVWGNALAFAGASLLAFLFNIGGVLKLIPFFMFLGLHPLLNYLQRKFIKKKVLHALAFIGKALWFDGMLLFTWFVLTPVFGFTELTFYETLEQYLWYFVFFGGTALFAAYDVAIFFCQRTMDMLVKRLRK